MTKPRRTAARSQLRTVLPETMRRLILFFDLVARIALEAERLFIYPNVCFDQQHVHGPLSRQDMILYSAAVRARLSVVMNGGKSSLFSTCCPWNMIVGHGIRGRMMKHGPGSRSFSC